MRPRALQWPIGPDAKRGGEFGAHLVDERGNLRPFEHDGHVDVLDHKPLRLHQAHGVTQHPSTRRPLPARIRVWIVLADVSGADRPKHRVDHGMTDHVGVGVPGGAFV